MTYVRTEEDLDQLLTQPTEDDIRCLQRLPGDVLLLGAGGKMGPTLARRIKLASDLAGCSRRVFAASRWSDRLAAEGLRRTGVETVECELTDQESLGRLPDAPNVLFLAGRKFGSTGRPDLTWAINTIVPAYCAERFKGSRIVVFSTGNLYPFKSATSGGATEEEIPRPVGEYAQSCLGRERVFEYFSNEHKTPGLFYRLNYAVDLRYGVLVDIARKVKAGQPVDLTTGSFNVIWQGDANSYALRCLEFCSTPPRVLNVTGPETVSVRWAAEFFGRRWNVEPTFTGEESGQALLNNASTCHALLGYPKVSLGTLIDWVADWVEHGGRLLDKPTKFEVQDGKY